jgi:hypothetical protein
MILQDVHCKVTRRGNSQIVPKFVVYVNQPVS